jgi:hypothetical protein
MIETERPGESAVLDHTTSGLGSVFLQPHDAVDVLYRHGWQEPRNLATMTAIGGAESQWGVHAWHDNLDDAGDVVSRDVGWLQINVPASAIGTKAEADLYDPEYNALRARMLYTTRLSNGLIRGFQPWAAFNSGVYLHDHYAGTAALGVMNYLAADLNRRGATLPLPIFSTHDLAAKLAAK